MRPADFVLYWKRTFRVVLPMVLAVDMVHSMYYVAGLYQKRVQVSTWPVQVVKPSFDKFCASLQARCLALAGVGTGRPR